MSPFNTEKGIVNKLVKEILEIRGDVLERLENLEEQVEVELPLVTEERLQELVGSITPIKGKDYFTDEEKEELISSIQALIDTPQVGKDYFTDDEKARFTGEIRKKLSKELADAILKIKPKEVVREVAKEVTPDEIASKLNTLDGVIDSKVVKGIPTIEDFLKELKDPKGKNKLSAEHILNMPARGKLDQRWHGAGDTVEAGENITITEVDGKKVISATSGGAVDSVNGQTGVVVLDAEDVGAVASVTGLDTDNADPTNPIVKIAVDGSTITGQGTPADPLVATTDLSGYVPYTGADQTLNMGLQELRFSDGSNFGGMRETGSAFQIMSRSNNAQVEVVNQLTNYNAVLDFSEIDTTNKIFTFPNETGTLALTSDIPTNTVVTDPATQAKNTIQPTANVTGLTLQKQYTEPTQIQPDALSTGTLIGWWIGDDFTTGAGTWADHGPNGYNLTGYCAGTGTLNGHKTLLFNGSGYFQNTSGFTISQPYVVFAVVKANYSGTAYPGGTFVASGQSPYAMLAQYYEAENLSPGFSMYSGGGWEPKDKYGTVGLATVVVANYNGASSYIRSGGNVNTTGNPGSNSMTGVTIGNGYSYLAAASGAVAEVIIVTSPSDAEISGIEGYLAVKYNLELASNTQTDDMMELKTGVGDSFWRIDANGTIVPKLLAGSASALDIGVFSDAYPRFKLTPARIEIGDGTYDVEGQTGLYQKGWEFNAPTTVNGNFGFISKSNYVDQEFQIRPPGNSLFSVNTGTYKMVLNTGLGGFIGPSAAGNVALDVRGYSSQTASLQRWTNSSATVLTHINKDGYLAIGSQSPTAYLHLKAGTATAGTAPLKLTSGTLNTTAEAGAIEFLTDDYFATITTGAARKAFVLDDGTRLTSGRIPFATTNGRLTDDADLTFATDTLTATKVVGSTSVKAGSAGGFISSDGSAGATGSFTTADAKTVTVKDGIITSIV